jgi:hypothetical protein
MNTTTKHNNICPLADERAGIHKCLSPGHAAESKNRSPKNDAHENFTKEEQIYKVFQQTERKYDVQFRWKFAARK